LPELSPEELRLVLQALEDAAFFRESRASAMERVARKGRRGIVEAPVGEADKQRSRDYMALIVRLRQK
jgi:hypothetical protein